MMTTTTMMMMMMMTLELNDDDHLNNMRNIDNVVLQSLLRLNGATESSTLLAKYTINNTDNKSITFDIWNSFILENNLCVDY